MTVLSKLALDFQPYSSLYTSYSEYSVTSASDRSIAQDRGKDSSMAIVLVLIVIGSIGFHVFSPWWWTSIASNWSVIDDMISVTFWITGFVFAAVILFMAYCVFAFVTARGVWRLMSPRITNLSFG